jgi:hypothetical protein
MGVSHPRLEADAPPGLKRPTIDAPSGLSTAVPGLHCLIENCDPVFAIGHFEKSKNNMESLKSSRGGFGGAGQASRLHDWGVGRAARLPDGSRMRRHFGAARFARRLASGTLALRPKPGERDARPAFQSAPSSKSRRARVCFAWVFLPPLIPVRANWRRLRCRRAARHVAPAKAARTRRTPKQTGRLPLIFARRHG